MTWLPTGAVMRRIENLVAHEGPIYWSPMTIAETEHLSENERFSSEELGTGAGLTVVESLFIRSGIYKGKKGKVHIHGRMKAFT